MKLYPSVGMKKQPNVHVSANFGQQPFIFDIDGFVKVGYLRVLRLNSYSSPCRKKGPAFFQKSV